MGGRASKQKGRQGEYLLRNHLRLNGWSADRVYASGAIPGLPCDVKATKGDKTLLFEMKFRKDSFKRIYELYDLSRKETKDDLMAICIPQAEQMCVNISTSLDAVLDNPDFYTIANEGIFTKFTATVGKIGNLQKLLGKADILCVKDNNKPLLFLRYR